MWLFGFFRCLIFSKGHILNFSLLISYNVTQQQKIILGDVLPQGKTKAEILNMLKHDCCHLEKATVNSSLSCFWHWLHLIEIGVCRINEQPTLSSDIFALHTYMMHMEAKKCPNSLNFRLINDQCPMQALYIAWFTAYKYLTSTCIYVFYYYHRR